VIGIAGHLLEEENLKTAVPGVRILSLGRQVSAAEKLCGFAMKIT